MLARDYRFRGLNSLKPLFKRGQSVRGDGLKLVYTTTNRPRNRFAVVVSKKVHKSAVVRNRIRRRVFSVIDDIKHAEPTSDLAVVVYDRRLETMEHKQLETSLLAAFEQVFKTLD